MLVKSVGTEGMSNEAIRAGLDRGGRFVIYQYCISVVFMTFKRPSAIYFLRADEGAGGKGVKFTLLSVLFGWWGIPWGPIWTLMTVFKNLGGGTDVTRQVMASIAPTEPVVAAPGLRQAPF